jgi:dTDP-4-dehydrorhamnose 3,5-epimerase-like enzyme
MTGPAAQAWEVIPLSVRADARGELIEVFRAPATGLSAQGQVYVVVSRAGAVRGNHYHRRKTEWFFVWRGAGAFDLTDLRTGTRARIILDGAAPALLKVCPWVHHRVEGHSGEDLYVLAYVDEAFDPGDPDTYPEVFIM